MSSDFFASAPEGERALVRLAAEAARPEERRAGRISAVEGEDQKQVRQAASPDRAGQSRVLPGTGMRAPGAG